ncbi:hypothetical protein Dimus_022437 [Dionaea muscipula]
MDKGEPSRNMSHRANIRSKTPPKPAVEEKLTEGEVTTSKGQKKKEFLVNWMASLIEETRWEIAEDRRKLKLKLKS